MYLREVSVLLGSIIDKGRVENVLCSEALELPPVHLPFRTIYKDLLWFKLWC